jgi:hypothetical protein
LSFFPAKVLIPAMDLNFSTSRLPSTFCIEPTCSFSPNSQFLDAVETQPSTPDRRLPKKLSPELDAGFGFVPGGSYSSQALMRKVDRVENGRRILKDTNNSTEDFEWIMPAIPGGFK